jgi:methyltransferase (TIGR00027 family)
MNENQISSTAYLIARSTRFLSLDRELGRFVPDGSRAFSRDVVAALARFPRLTDSLYRLPPNRLIIKTLERAMLPGIQLHYALRKACIERIVRASLNQGFGRVWVVAAGFDSLALRLAGEFPTADFIELDRPAIQAVKRSICERSGSARANLEFVPADLTAGLPPTLNSANLSRIENNLFIFEGIFMYLDESEVRKTLRDVAQSAGSSTRVVFTFMDVLRPGQIRFHNANPLINCWLRRKGEVFRWGIAADDLAGFLDELGFTLLEIVRADDLRTEFLGPDQRRIPLAEGECLCVAESR